MLSKLLKLLLLFATFALKMCQIIDGSTRTADSKCLPDQLSISYTPFWTYFDDENIPRITLLRIALSGKASLVSSFDVEHQSEEWRTVKNNTDLGRKG